MRYNKRLLRAQRDVFNEAIINDAQGLFSPSDFAAEDSEVRQTLYLMDGKTCIAGIVIETLGCVTIKRVFVPADYRCRGVARKVIDDVADMACSSGEEALYVQWTPASRGFWEQRGFVAVPSGARNDFGAMPLCRQP